MALRAKGCSVSVWIAEVLDAAFGLQYNFHAHPAYAKNLNENPTSMLVVVPTASEQTKAIRASCDLVD